MCWDHGACAVLLVLAIFCCWSVMETDPRCMLQSCLELPPWIFRIMGDSGRRLHSCLEVPLWIIGITGDSGRPLHSCFKVPPGIFRVPGITEAHGLGLVRPPLLRTTTLPITTLYRILRPFTYDYLLQSLLVCLKHFEIWETGLLRCLQPIPSLFSESLALVPFCSHPARDRT